jgi:chromosome partitioning protein
MIIAIANQDGAPEQALVASQLAQLRVRSGCKVKLLDANTATGRTLPDQLESLRRRYYDIVIDTGGHDMLESRAALIAAGLVVVPFAPGQSSRQLLTTRLDTARMFNPGLRVLYAAIGDAGDPTPAEMDALYREVFAH